MGETIKAWTNDVRIVAVEPFECQALTGGVTGPHNIPDIGFGLVPKMCIRDRFTSGLAKFDQAVAEGKLTYVVGTNLTYRTPELLTRDWYVDVDVSKYAAYFVVALNHDMSVSSIIDPLKKLSLIHI